MTVKAKALVHEGRILVRTTFGHNEFDEAVDMSKAVGGGRWAKAHKAWSYPLAVDTCLALRQVFGEHLTVMPNLSEWYIEAAAQRSGQEQAAKATDAELHNLPTNAPALFAALRPDQRAGAAWVAAGYRGGGLLADQPGCGKTLITIAGVLEADLQGPILVACPRLSVKAVWHKEIAKWTGERVYIARGTRAKRQRAIDRFMEDPAERKWLIVVVEMLRVKDGTTQKDMTFEYPSLFGIRWAQVIVDESHKAFGSLTITKGNLAGRGLKALAGRTDRRLAVTGTPFGRGGRIQGMFGTLHWLWPDEFTSFWRWAGNHFVIEEEEVRIAGGRGRTRTVKRIAGLKSGIDQEQFLHTFGPRILRRTKAEVLPWLPPKQYVDVICEATPAQVRQYKTLDEDGEILSGGGVISVNGTLALITRAKQLANGEVTLDEEGRVHFTGTSGKIDQLFEFCEARGILDGSGDTKIIVASQFNEFLEVVEERFVDARVAHHKMTGSTSDVRRDAMMASFQEAGGPRVFLLNSKAGGVSVTLDAADEVHCLDELWDPGDNEQLEDRAHRASRNHAVSIYRYRTEGTIDEKIAEDVEAKRFDQYLTLDGRRGLEYARSIVTYRKPQEDNAS